MTNDFTNDEQLGAFMRDEVPAAGAQYWNDIATTIGVPINVDQSDDDQGQPIDVVARTNSVVPLRGRLPSALGGTAALVAAAAALIIVGLLFSPRLWTSGEEVNSGFAQQGDTIVTDPVGLAALPGPTQNLDHWHAVYGVWDCAANNGQGAWLPHFDSSRDDTGIHSHDDGLIYIHPFFEESSGRNATFSHFISEMQLELTDTELTLENGNTLTEGTTCGDQEAVLHLRRWQFDFIARTETASSARIITEDLNAERFYNDREVWVLALAPLDAELPLPPAERFNALDGWGLPAVETDQPLAATDTRQPLIDVRTMNNLDADRAQSLRSPPGPVTLWPSNEPTTVLSELTRSPRPGWTNDIVEGTFGLRAATHQDSGAIVVIANYQIRQPDGALTWCVAAIDTLSRQIAGRSNCQPDGQVSSLVIEEHDSSLLVANAADQAAFLLAETEAGTRILSNVFERFAYLGWDFVEDPPAELTFYSAALQPIGTCDRNNAQTTLECVLNDDS